MSHEVTANKYRPQDFNNLSGQNLVTSAIKNLLDKKNIPNAFLLSGPRGVGKTSTARIIAKGLNCKTGPTGNPCNKCENCITIKNGNNSDVIEIDGASNTSINDIKTIQEEILYPPLNSNYKVYIIDEVHMLSKNAFNALLKTIEEPPEYVVFIFATTEINQVPTTIRSRCQQYNLRLLPVELIVNNLKNVLNDKNIKYDDNALLWIANEGKGSMRDSFTILDQVIAFCENDITIDKIYKKMGITSNSLIIKLLKELLSNNLNSTMATYFQIIETGIQHEQLLNDLIKSFRDILFIKCELKNNVIDPNLYSEEILNSISINEIENILEISYSFFEKMKYSINLALDFEFYIIRLSNFRNYIRPLQIINEINKIKNSIINNSEKSSSEEKKKLIPSSVVYKKEIIYENKQPILGISKNDNIVSNLNGDVIYKILEHSSNDELSKLIKEVDMIEVKNDDIYLYLKKVIYSEILKNNVGVIKKEIYNTYKKNFNIKIILENNNQKGTNSINKEKIITTFNGYEI